MTTHYIQKWEMWQELCWLQHENPHERVDLSVDLGGEGNTVEFEYTGDYPEKEEE